eukprot:3101421-Pyramimonas_sp.AAC.1
MPWLALALAVLLGLRVKKCFSHVGHVQQGSPVIAYVRASLLSMVMWISGCWLNSPQGSDRQRTPRANRLTPTISTSCRHRWRRVP